MERCPICRALLNGTDTCRRCRAELGSVIGAERLARHLLGEAMYRLTLGERIDAGRLLRRSLLLHRTREALTILRLGIGTRRGASRGTVTLTPDVTRSRTCCPGRHEP